MRQIDMIYELVEHSYVFGYYMYNVKYPYFHEVFGVKNDKYYFVCVHGSYSVKRSKDGIRTMLEIEGVDASQFLRQYFPTTQDNVTAVEDILDGVKGWDE